MTDEIVSDGVAVGKQEGGGGQLTPCGKDVEAARAERTRPRSSPASACHSRPAWGRSPSRSCCVRMRDQLIVARGRDGGGGETNWRSFLICLDLDGRTNWMMGINRAGCVGVKSVSARYSGSLEVRAAWIRARPGRPRPSSHGAPRA